MAKAGAESEAAYCCSFEPAVTPVVIATAATRLAASASRLPDAAIVAEQQPPAIVTISFTAAAIVAVDAGAVAGRLAATCDVPKTPTSAACWCWSAASLPPSCYWSTCASQSTSGSQVV